MTTQPRSFSSGPLKYRVGVLLLVCAGIFFAVRGNTMLPYIRCADFKPLYGGARCLLHNKDPYDVAQVRDEYLRGGGDPEYHVAFRPYNASYPPSSLLLVVPFALLPWKLAYIAWMLLSTAALLLAAFLIADLCAPRDELARNSSLAVIALLAIFLATSKILVVIGQPAALAIALAVIAIWCLLRDRFGLLTILCFAISLALKPTIACFLLLYFFLAVGRYRRRARQILAVAAVIAIAGAAWATLMPSAAHWPAELRANTAGMAAPGNSSDSGPTNPEVLQLVNLQTVTSLLFPTRLAYNAAALSLCAALFIAWGILILRSKPSWQRDLLALAAGANLSLLPLYHRGYDTRLLLLVFPAVALLFAGRQRRLGAAALLLTAWQVFVTSTLFLNIELHFAPRLHAATPMVTILALRVVPLSLLAGAVFYLGCMACVLRPETAVCES